MNTLKIDQGNSYKIGLDEIVGLKDVLNEVIKPLVDHLNEQQSWTSPDWFQVECAEYKSRDGFIPHSDNLGGLVVAAIIPECGQGDFPMCSFPEFEPSSDNLTDEEIDAERESDGANGYLDSYLRIFLKLESIDPETGEMKFYINACTCDEAPYFRLKYSSDLFESEFTVTSFKQLRTVGAKHINKLIKVLS
jgi:hypothetical protein